MHCTKHKKDIPIIRDAERKIKRMSNIILSDEELRLLTEDTPFAEGDSLSELQTEARRVMEAIKNDGTDFECLEYRSRLIYLFRAFYLLGVLRGGEAYRFALASQTETDYTPEEAAFQLDGVCADSFVTDISGADPDSLGELYSLLGL